jgi:hypothetical protein
MRDGIKELTKMNCLLNAANIVTGQAEEALNLYERNWRFVELQQLTPDELELIDRLREEFRNPKS